MRSLALDVTGLVPAGRLHLDGPLLAAAVVCAAVACLAVALAVVLSRPRRRRRGPMPAHSGRDASRTAWHRRIDRIVERHTQGALSREEAFVELAAVARSFASHASGRDLTASTLAEIASSRPDGGAEGRRGIDLLRTTVDALYPPEFADGTHDARARAASVEDAAGWVRSLIDRWGRRP